MSRYLVLGLLFTVSANAGSVFDNSRKITCGMDRSEIYKMHGKPNSEMHCPDGLYEAIRYNRVWIVLKGEAAFYLIDLKDFHGPCLSNQILIGKALCE